MQSDDHFLTDCRKWSETHCRLGPLHGPRIGDGGSLVRCRTGDADEEPRLSRWPIDSPPDWTLRVNMPMNPAEEEAVQRSIRRGQPYGTEPCQKRTASRLGLESMFRPRDRAVKNPNNGT